VSNRQIKHQEAINFILGGKATVTFQNRETLNRYTFKVVQPKPSMPYFVKVLVGSDNENSYNFIGTIFNSNGIIFKHSRKSRVTEKATSVRVFAYVLKNLLANKLPKSIEIWHEGRCCCCGRKLTVPSSIESGIGPECSKRYSLIYTDKDLEQQERG